jgi:hypothetical protein
MIFYVEFESVSAITEAEMLLLYGSMSEAGLLNNHGTISQDGAFAYATSLDEKRAVFLFESIGGNGPVGAHDDFRIGIVNQCKTAIGNVFGVDSLLSWYVTASAGDFYSQQWAAEQVFNRMMQESEVWWGE